jgi:ankyrin repeat protein
MSKFCVFGLISVSAALVSGIAFTPNPSPTQQAFAAAAGWAVSSTGADRLASKLASAIERGNIKQVESLLARGASPDLGEKVGIRLPRAPGRASDIILMTTFTPLSNVLFSVNDEGTARRLVELLLSNGANPNAPDHLALGRVAWVTCPLNIAIREESRLLVDLLLSKGADPNGPENASSTPLYTATWQARLVMFSGHGPTVPNLLQTETLVPNIVADLLAAGADVNRPINGTLAIVGDNPEDQFVLLQLATFQGNAGATFKKGATPLHAAAMHGLADLVSLYLAKGANPNAKDEWGDTALHEAVSRGKSVVIVKSLIASGADVNAKNNTGDAPLHEAASRTWSGVEEAVQLLTAAGASREEKNNSGQTPLDIATKANNTKLMSLLEP